MIFIIRKFDYEFINYIIDEYIFTNKIHLGKNKLFTFVIFECTIQIKYIHI